MLGLVFEGFGLYYLLLLPFIHPPYPLSYPKILTTLLSFSSTRASKEIHKPHRVEARLWLSDPCTQVLNGSDDHSALGWSIPSILVRQPRTCFLNPIARSFRPLKLYVRYGRGWPCWLEGMDARLLALFFIGCRDLHIRFFRLRPSFLVLMC